MTIDFKTIAENDYVVFTKTPIDVIPDDKLDDEGNAPISFKFKA